MPSLAKALYRGMRGGSKGAKSRGSYVTESPKYASNMASTDSMSGGWEEGAHVRKFIPKPGAKIFEVVSDEMHRLVEEPGANPKAYRLLKRRLVKQGYDFIDDRKLGNQLIVLNPKALK